MFGEIVEAVIDEVVSGKKKVRRDEFQKGDPRSNISVAARARMQRAGIERVKDDDSLKRLARSMSRHNTSLSMWDNKPKDPLAGRLRVQPAAKFAKERPAYARQYLGFKRVAKKSS